MTIFVTGGAGFIGSNFVVDWFTHSDEPVLNLDLLTYAGNLRNLERLRNDPRHVFVRGDIGDLPAVTELLRHHRPRAMVNFAAESHVDRSVHGSGTFVQTNIVGTWTLLEAARSYWKDLPEPERSAFRFLHISTDEVFGSLGPAEEPVTESRRYEPNSPYSASKSASDHLVRAWHQTYGLPVLTSNCGNNYGPFQFPEKLIPLVILNALSGKPLPIYGDGLQVRDWLYVGDHCSALRHMLAGGHPGSTFNIGGSNEQTNIDVVRAICALLDELKPSASGPYARLITHVTDRPGHDRRHAIDAGKIKRDLGWSPAETFASGLRRTVSWYLKNDPWLADVQSGQYREWIQQNYDARS